MFNKKNLRPSTMCSCVVLTAASIIEHRKFPELFASKSLVTITGSIEFRDNLDGNDLGHHCNLDEFHVGDGQ